MHCLLLHLESAYYAENRQFSNLFKHAFFEPSALVLSPSARVSAAPPSTLSAEGSSLLGLGVYTWEQGSTGALVNDEGGPEAPSPFFSSRRPWSWIF